MKGLSRLIVLVSPLIALASAAAIPAAWAWGGWLIAGGHVKNGVFFVTMVPVILVLFTVMFGILAAQDDGNPAP